ncbi:hypothetical protein [Terriglobus tenax]|uniref:hypothetical protein n=1 Tax=Terriglobus tenax TaxID=1111115 RepID=UPI0021E053E3|nr:hypothetical protein [Terriglobus tenax]
MLVLDLFIRGLSHVLVPMFFFGLVGSAFVVVISTAHDVLEVFTPDEEHADSDL